MCFIDILCVFVTCVYHFLIIVDTVKSANKWNFIRSSSDVSWVSRYPVFSIFKRSPSCYTTRWTIFWISFKRKWPLIEYTFQSYRGCYRVAALFLIDLDSIQLQIHGSSLWIFLLGGKFSRIHLIFMTASVNPNENFVSNYHRSEAKIKLLSAQCSDQVNFISIIHQQMHTFRSIFFLLSHFCWDAERMQQQWVSSISKFNSNKTNKLTHNKKMNRNKEGQDEKKTTCHGNVDHNGRRSQNIHWKKKITLMKQVFHLFRTRPKSNNNNKNNNTKEQIKYYFIKYKSNA